MTASRGAARQLSGGPVLALLLVVLLLFAPVTTVVSDTPSGAAWFGVYDVSAQRLVHTVPVGFGEPIELEHTHSVHRRPVVEVFAASPTHGLVMEEMRFDAHGANLPSGPETIDGIETTFLKEGSGYRVLHHGRPLDTVRMIVGTADVDHVLTASGETIRLLDHSAPGARVEMFVWARQS